MQLFCECFAVTVENQLKADGSFLLGGMWLQKFNLCHAALGSHSIAESA